MDATSTKVVHDVKNSRDVTTPIIRGAGAVEKPSAVDTATTTEAVDSAQSSHSVDAFRTRGNHEPVSADSYTAVASRIGATEGWPWSDIDWSEGKAVACGVSKCYFKSTSNLTVGYLVAPMKEGNQRRFDEMLKAFTFAQRMHEDYGVPLLTLDPPQMLKIQPVIVTLINNYTHMPQSQRGDRLIFAPDRDKRVVVQRMLTVPAPNFFVKIDNVPYLHTFVDFRKQITNPEAFSKQLLLDINKINQMVNTSEYYHLIRDFQGIVGHDGRFYHIDLDRSRPGGDMQQNREWLRVNLECLHWNLTSPADLPSYCDEASHKSWKARS
jgi:hypothetical protein